MNSDSLKKDDNGETGHASSSIPGRALGVVAITVVAFLCWHVWSGSITRDEIEVGMADASSRQALGSRVPDDRTPVSPDRQSASVLEQGFSVGESWQEEFGCNECPPAWNVAQTQEEAAWMHRSGFPSRRTRDQYAKLADRELRIRFDSGDLAAAAVLAERMIERSDPDAELFLEMSAARGSIYALYRIADGKEHGDNLYDQLTAGAALRAAFMRGDHVAAEELKRRLPTLTYVFSPANVGLLDSQTAVMLRNLEALRREMGYPPLQIDPRPYVELETQERMAATQDVHRRARSIGYK
jgi:hypothetical protein